MCMCVGRGEEGDRGEGRKAERSTRDKDGDEAMHVYGCMWNESERNKTKANE